MANNYEGKYQNFMFMAGWRDMLEGMAEDVSLEFAQEALWNLMLVSTFVPSDEDDKQELTTDKKMIVGFIQGCIEPVVKTSTSKYNKNKNNGIKGGRPKIDIDVAEAKRLHDEEGMKWKDVAKKMGVSEDTLRVARKEYEEIEKPKNPEIKTEKLQAEKVEKPKNPLVSRIDDETSRKTEKPKNGIEIAGFRF